MQRGCAVCNGAMPFSYGKFFHHKLHLYDAFIHAHLALNVVRYDRLIESTCKMQE